MQDPFITALNTQKAALGWFSALTENMANIYSPSYRETKFTFSDFVNGVQLSELEKSPDQGKSMPGKSPTNLMIEGKGYFVLRKADGNLAYTRLGDFKFNGEGMLVNEAGDKVQGTVLGDNGQPVQSAGQGSTAAQPSSDIQLWVDPSNGKFFGKYDEYKIQSDGTVVGLANKGKEVEKLYQISLVSFANPGGLAEVSENQYAPTVSSGEAVVGSGEVRSGLLEMSNVSLRQQVAYLQQAKLQLDVTAKLINTNKNLLEESLRLLQ